MYVSTKYSELIITFLRSFNYDKAIITLHDFAYLLVTTSKKRLMENKWNCPLKCFIAGFAMRSEEAFMDAEELTTYLAQLKYGIRCVIFQQTIMAEDEFDNDFEK